MRLSDPEKIKYIPGQPVKCNKRICLEYYKFDYNYTVEGDKVIRNYAPPGTYTISLRLEHGESILDKDLSSREKAVKKFSNNYSYRFGDTYGMVSDSELFGKKKGNFYGHLNKKRSNYKNAYGLIKSIKSEKDNNYRVEFETELGKVTTTLHAGHIVCDKEGHRDRQIKKLIK